MQTKAGWANTMREAAPKLYHAEGLWGFYKGLTPLWMRQIPYTMMKFSCFEKTVGNYVKYDEEKKNKENIYRPLPLPPMNYF